jgi:N6-adenosine-specific RNA methylase IME4
VADREQEPSVPPEQRRYATIVVDPPWEYGKSRGFSWREGRPSGERGPMLAYPTMSVEKIAAMPVRDLAADDAHLYLWTTQRYLWRSPEIVRAWGFEPSTILVWCKPPTGFSLGGTFGKASEFCLFARRGRLPALSRTNRDWWEWPRREHSAKPEAFLDLVERVSPAPRLEMFARRQRLGWDTWGDQALNHVSLVPSAARPSECS